MTVSPASFFARFGPLSPGGEKLLRSFSGGVFQFDANREIKVPDGKGVAQLMLLSGWVGRQALLADGRRQIFNLILPGDIIGLLVRDANNAAGSAIAALTPATMVDMTGLAEQIKADPASFPELKLAMERTITLQLQFLDNQILRLGRLDALERTAHLLLELHARLSSVDLIRERGYTLPATQETLADILGLSHVHLNRMLQTLKREGFIQQVGPRIELVDIERLAFRCGFGSPVI
jgi:CRP-like cAMP-binding protein